MAGGFIRCTYAHLQPGGGSTWHRATLDFVMDDEGYERMKRVLHDEFGKDIGPIRPALPPGPIEGELIDED